MKTLFALVISLWFFLAPQAKSQKIKSLVLELENFKLITDQDFYLAGDRVWFAAKLLKNHESYRYSKLAYIAVLDASGNIIHQEKMLLTGQDMVFGDFFLSENSQTGIFSLVVYSKWMANYEDFPVARKKFLVANPNAPTAEGRPALFWEQIPFENAPVSIFHTSDQAEVIEIQDKEGRTIEILEAVPPLKPTLSNVKPTDVYSLVFRNSSFQIEPQKWYWDPVDFSLSFKRASDDKELKVVTHSDWEILEKLDLAQDKVQLDKALYQNMSFFDITVLDGSNRVQWSYRVQLPIKKSGELIISSRGKVGEPMTLDLAGFSSQFKDGIVMARAETTPLISGFVDILNHPNWKNLAGESIRPNLVATLPKVVESPFLVKDYSPMFDYKVWSIEIKTRFRSSTQSAGFSFSLSDQMLDPLINRRVYREHFDITDEVVALQSPFQADKVYQIEDYFEFPDLESFMKEIVSQVRLKKSKSQEFKEIFIANTDNEAVKFNKRPRILVDFYGPISLEEFWKLDLVTVDRIELFYNRSTIEATNLGETVGDGLIVVYTKNNEYFLKNNLGKERYFLADVSVPRRPEFSIQGNPKISANALHFMDPDLTFYRGRGKGKTLNFNTAGSWLVEAWIFGNSNFELIQKRVEIDP